MRLRPPALLAFAATLLTAACGDSTTAPSTLAPHTLALGKSSKPDTSAAAPAPGGGNAGGGAGGGGGSAAPACGTFSANIQTYNIVVYTTRVGIGFSGSATNCGGKKAAFEVDVVDTDPDPACTVAVPHFIAAKNTDPGSTVFWSANSTLVPCMNKMHNFVLTLWDTKTNTKLATATASAFL